MERASVRPLDVHVEVDFDEDAQSAEAPMLEMTIKLFGWRRGQAEIETNLYPNDALGDPFKAPPEEAERILSRLHARLQEEIGEAFEIFRRC